MTLPLIGRPVVELPFYITLYISKPGRAKKRKDKGKRANRKGKAAFGKMCRGEGRTIQNRAPENPEKKAKEDRFRHKKSCRKDTKIDLLIKIITIFNNRQIAGKGIKIVEDVQNRDKGFYER